MYHLSHVAPLCEPTLTLCTRTLPSPHVRRVERPSAGDMHEVCGVREMRQRRHYCIRITDMHSPVCVGVHVARLGLVRDVIVC